MKEIHYAYRVSHEPEGIACTQRQIEADKMLDLLLDIKKSKPKGLYWVFKQIDGQPQEALSIIDCEHQRIYFHYSGDVFSIDDVIQKLKS